MPPSQSVTTLKNLTKPKSVFPALSLNQLAHMHDHILKFHLKDNLICAVCGTPTHFAKEIGSKMLHRVVNGYIILLSVT